MIEGYLCVQCKTEDGRCGVFIVATHDSRRPITPVFDSLTYMLLWMHDHGWRIHDHAGMGPWRVERVDTRLNGVERAALIFWCGDVRECVKDGNEYIHILDPGFRISKHDPRIKEIKPLRPAWDTHLIGEENKDASTQRMVSSVVENEV
jgi:hypothetical protein